MSENTGSKFLAMRVGRNIEDILNEKECTPVKNALNGRNLNGFDFLLPVCYSGQQKTPESECYQGFQRFKVYRVGESNPYYLREREAY